MNYLKHAITSIRFRRTIGSIFIMVFATLFWVGEGISESAGQTLDERYPGLVHGVLKNARLLPMDEQVLLQSDGVTIRRAELDETIKGQDDRMRSQLEKNQLFVLEQTATRQILLNEAQKAGLKTGGRADQEIFQALFAHQTRTVTVSEKENRDFYQANKALVGGMPFEQVSETIGDYLLQEKKQQAIADYIARLGGNGRVRVNEQWVAAQRRLAMDNPVDAARSSGRPTLVEFGAAGCVPCDMMQPILDQLRNDFPDTLNVVFVHVGEEQLMAARFGIRSIPVQVFYDAHGKEVFRHVGFLPKEQVYRQLTDMGVVQ